MEYIDIILYLRSLHCEKCGSLCVNAGLYSVRACEELVLWWGVDDLTFTPHPQASRGPRFLKE